MNRKDRTILSKIKTSYVVAMIELMVLTGICFGLTTGKLQIARGQQYHGVGMICLILLDVMIVIGCVLCAYAVLRNERLRKEFAFRNLKKDFRKAEACLNLLCRIKTENMSCGREVYVSLKRSGRKKGRSGVYYGFHRGRGC